MEVASGAAATAKLLSQARGACPANVGACSTALAPAQPVPLLLCYLPQPPPPLPPSHASAAMQPSTGRRRAREGEARKSARAALALPRDCGGASRQSQRVGSCGSPVAPEGLWCFGAARTPQHHLPPSSKPRALPSHDPLSGARAVAASFRQHTACPRHPACSNTSPHLHSSSSSVCGNLLRTSFGL